VKNAAKKAKARAKAKSGAKSVNEGEAPPEEQRVGDVESGPSILEQGEFELRTRQYTEIANYLVQKEVVVPTEVFRLLKRCISLRQSVTRRFQAGQASRENEAHQHFIDTLIGVGEILKGSIDGSGKGAVGMEGTAAFGNRFVDLDVEGDVRGDDEEDIADIQLPEPPRATNAPSASRLTFGQAVDLSEGITSFLAFLGDVENVRDYIKDLWVDYKNGGVDLMTAAVTTNTALELLRKPHDDITRRVLPLVQNNLQMLIWASMSVLRGHTDFDMGSFQSVPDDDIVTGSLYDFFMIPVLSVLQGQACVINDGMVPIYKPGYYGTYYTNSGSLEKKSFQKRWSQCLILMTESFTDYLLLIQLGSHEKDQNLFFFDQTVLEMNKLAKTKEVTLFLMIVAQVFIDINFVLGSEAAKGLNELQKNAARMVKVLKERKVVEAGARAKNWDIKNEDVIRAFRSKAETWERGEPITAFRNQLGRTTPMAGLGGVQSKSSLFSRTPVLCGLILFQLHLQYQDIGLKLSNTWGTIMYTNHLLEACRHSGTEPGVSFPPWPDMDIVMRLHGEQDLFAGKTPRDLDESYTRYLRTAGTSERALEKFWREGLRGPDDDRLPGGHDMVYMKDHTQILPIFGQRYALTFVSETHLDIKVIDKLLSDITIDIQREEEKASRDAKAGGGPSKNKKPRLRRNRNHKSPKFSVVQLLAVLEAGLTHETLSIRFDYLAMHCRCIRVLRIVRDGADEYLTRKVGPNYLGGDESNLPGITGYILHWATMSGRAAEQMLGVDRKGGTVKSRLLVGATKGVASFLRESKEGDVETKRLGLSARG
jgi:hypothetical protein